MEKIIKKIFENEFITTTLQCMDLLNDKKPAHQKKPIKINPLFIQGWTRKKCW